jgi:hypothetical protein
LRWPSEFLQHSGLADSALPAKHGHPRLPRLHFLELRAELLQQRIAPHEGRLREARRRQFWRLDALHGAGDRVSAASQGLEDPLGLFCAQHTADRPDLHGPDGLDDSAARPEHLQELRFRDHAPRVLEQVAQHVEALRRQRQDLGTARQLIAVFVELELIEAIQHERHSRIRTVRAYSPAAASRGRSASRAQTEP